MRYVRNAILVFLALWGGAIQAAINSTTTVIKEIYSYAWAANGSVLMIPEVAPQGCNGFWLDPAEPGFSSNYAAALSAYQAQSPVLFYGDETQLLPVSSTPYCKVRVLRLRPK